MAKATIKETSVDRLLARFGWITRATAAAQTSRRVNRARAEEAIDWNNRTLAYDMTGNDDPITGTLRSYGYRRHRQRYLRDFTEFTHDEELEEVWKIYGNSPIAKRIMTLKRDHISGRRVTLVPGTEDETTQRLLADFWKRNKLNRRFGEWALQLFLLGEQCYTVHVRETDGEVKLGYIDPKLISDVLLDPLDRQTPRIVVVGEPRGGTGYLLRVVKEPEPVIIEDFVSGNVTVLVPDDRVTGRLMTFRQWPRDEFETKVLADYGQAEFLGDCLFYKVNALTNQPRGHSDLLQIVDWLTQADQTLFGLADRDQRAGWFFMDVTLHGADADMVLEREDEIRANPPMKGSVNVHNDSEEWDIKVPDVKQAGSIETFKALLALCLGGVGYPFHWYSFGDGTNRATAVAQGDPTHKSLEYDQGFVRDIALDLLQFQIDQAALAGQSLDEAAETDVSLPELTNKDLTSLLPLYFPFVQALEKATDQGYISDETAAGAFHKLLSEFDIRIETADELTKVEDAPGTNLTSDEGAIVLQVLMWLTSGKLEPDAARSLLVAIGLDETLAQQIISGTTGRNSGDVSSNPSIFDSVTGQANQNVTESANGHVSVGIRAREEAIEDLRVFVKAGRHFKERFVSDVLSPLEIDQLIVRFDRSLVNLVRGR